jgi:TonB family protein
MSGKGLRRLTWAVALSAGAHAVVLANVTLTPMSRGVPTSAAEPLHVRLAAADVMPAAPAESDPGPPTSAPARTRAQAAPAGASGAILPVAEHYYPGKDVDERAIPTVETELRYPEAALRDGISGVVKIRMLIDSRGTLREATVLESTPPNVFDEEALRAVHALKFRPAMRHGIQVGSIKIVEIPFFPDCRRTGSCATGERNAPERISDVGPAPLPGRIIRPSGRPK